MSKFLFGVFFFMSCLNLPESGFADSNPNIKSYNDFDLPLEPSTLFTMSQYNLSLCLFRTLFELDDSSMPVSKLLKSWKYIKNRQAYLFEIAEIKWSDGKPFTSQDIRQSFLRLKSVAPPQYSSLESLAKTVLPNSIVIINEKSLYFHVKEPNVELFKRLTAAFIPMIRNDQLDKNLNVANNYISLGPYIADKLKSTRDILVLRVNKNYVSYSSSMANLIILKKPPAITPRATDIITDGKWANLITDQAFITKSAFQELIDNNASIWTRPVDRVMYLFPTTKSKSHPQNITFLKWLGWEITKRPLNWQNFINIKSANSLQPPGFILNKKLEYPEIPKPKLTSNHLKIAYPNNQLPIDFISNYLHDHGIEAEFVFVEPKNLENAINSVDFDFILSAFGAADSSPVTWLTLVLEHSLKFIGDHENKYKNRFNNLKSIDNTIVRESKLRDLIYNAGVEGLYLPLAHFSSVAASSKELDLSNIRESDETVDLSKVMVK